MGKLVEAQRDSRAEQGTALLITMMVLLLVSLLAVTGLERSGEESTSGARLRASTRTLHAADSGIRLALSRITQSPPDLSAFTLNLAGGAKVESRQRSGLAPEDIEQLGLGSPTEGYGLSIGMGVRSVTRVYRLNTTAEAAGSTVALEAKLMRSGAEATGY